MAHFPQDAENTLSYRLGQGVVRRVPDDGPCLLIRHFPLKAVTIPRFWLPVLDAFNDDEDTPFSDLVHRIPDIPSDTRSDTVESFLNNLVRKGFLEMRGIPPLPEPPAVSVVIPVRNRPSEIAACLKSLARLDYPAEKIEIIVVDDASEDDTPKVVSGFPVRLIRQPKRRQAAACRNLGARHASGEMLAFIDSDCLADPMWLRELVPAFRDPGLGALGGMVDAWFDDNGLDRYEKVKSALKMGTWFKRSRMEEQFFYVPACNFLIRRDLFLRLCGFREELHVGEDVDLCWRVQDSGAHIEFRPAGAVYHKHRNQLRPFCARRFDYGTSEPLLQTLHPDRVKQMLLPPAETLFWTSAGFAALMLSWMFACGASAVLLVDAVRRHETLRRRGIAIRFGDVLLAVVRSHLAFAYHCCSFVSRYYLIPVPLLLPFAPTAGAFMIGMHIVAGMVEYGVKKPRIDPLSFLFYFTLEQASYQAGVWWGCVKYRRFQPLFPRLVHATGSSPG